MKNFSITELEAINSDFQISGLLLLDTIVVETQRANFKIEVYQRNLGGNLETRVYQNNRGVWTELYDFPWCNRDTVDGAIRQALGFLRERFSYIEDTAAA